MRKLIALTLIAGMTVTAARADEGMWLLNLLKKMRMAEMKDMGLELSAKDIYAVNQSSMKDGLLMLNGGSCTAELISDKGLALTNHHCAYDAIRSHSDTGSKNYLEHGFWAQDRSKELPIEGMSASILVRIEDVSDRFNKALSDSLSQMQRERKKQKIKAEVKKNAFEKGKPYRAEVKEFYSGDSFYLFVYKDFDDVRLVGAPPSDIGKFGGNEDNWEWPRHTGDFSLLRVYANENNKPAAYSEDNVPYQPAHHFPVSLNGVDKGDLTFIMGFPGRTQRYLSSFGVDQALNREYPAVIKLRDKRLDLMREAMDASEKVDIAYASKYAQVSNYYKYFKGQSQRLRDLEVKAKKKELEKDFKKWVNAEKGRKERYGGTIEALKKSYKQEKSLVVPMVYLREAALASELVRFGLNFMTLQNALSGDDTARIKKVTADLKASAKEHFRNYHAPTDRKITNALYEMFYQNVDNKIVPEPIVKHEQNPSFFRKLFGSTKGYGDVMFENSFLDDEEAVMKFLENPDLEKLKNDKGYKTARAVMKTFRGKLGMQNRQIQMQRKSAKRKFIRGLREMKPDKDFYPNANSTPRLTYGTVGGYEHPTDGLLYDFHTTLGGAISKDDTTKRLFDVPQKLEELYKKKDYGRYAEDSTGNMRICFVHNTDITGGNSGSPVFNKKGHLVGCAFDGNWEAMSGDIAYQARLQRTISVDARYILFVIDKFANADHLIEEMTIVNGEGTEKEKG
ncbi:MAG: S46 family peptidase [Flavobacteriales bacterium]